MIYFFNSLTNSAEKIQDIFKREDDNLMKDRNYKIEDKKKDDIKKAIYKILKCLKIKVTIFINVEFLILLFFWYYVTAFCHVYVSTQKSWLVDCCVSFLISIVIEVVILN